MSNQEQLPLVELYTDGACSGNPGPGGWAFIIKDRVTGTEVEQSGGESSTTNNRMELISVIEGLRALESPSTVELYSDSQYVVNGLNEWMDQWKSRNWRTADRKPVKNQDLWLELDSLRTTHRLKCHWIRGHNEHPENERADRLAVAAIDRFRKASNRA